MESFVVQLLNNGINILFHAGKNNLVCHNILSCVSQLCVSGIGEVGEKRVYFLRVF